MSEVVEAVKIIDKKNMPEELADFEGLGLNERNELVGIDEEGGAKRLTGVGALILKLAKETGVAKEVAKNEVESPAHLKQIQELKEENQRLQVELNKSQEEKKQLKLEMNRLSQVVDTLSKSQKEMADRIADLEENQSLAADKKSGSGDKPENLPTKERVNEMRREIEHVRLKDELEPLFGDRKLREITNNYISFHNSQHDELEEIEDEDERKSKAAAVERRLENVRHSIALGEVGRLKEEGYEPPEDTCEKLERYLELAPEEAEVEPEPDSRFADRRGGQDGPESGGGVFGRFRREREPRQAKVERPEYGRDVTIAEEESASEASGSRSFYVIAGTIGALVLAASAGAIGHYFFPKKAAVPPAAAGLSDNQIDKIKQAVKDEIQQELPAPETIRINDGRVQKVFKAKNGSVVIHLAGIRSVGGGVSAVPKVAHGGGHLDFFNESAGHRRTAVKLPPKLRLAKNSAGHFVIVNNSGKTILSHAELPQGIADSRGVLSQAARKALRSKGYVLGYEKLEKAGSGYRYMSTVWQG